MMAFVLNILYNMTYMSIGKLKIFKGFASGCRGRDSKGGVKESTRARNDKGMWQDSGREVQERQ